MEECRSPRAALLYDTTVQGSVRDATGGSSTMLHGQVPPHALRRDTSPDAWWADLCHAETAYAWLSSTPTPLSVETGQRPSDTGEGHDWLRRQMPIGQAKSMPATQLADAR
jgi:hypothetical protein